MAVISSGLLMCRIKEELIEFLLVHPGGPYYAGKNDGIWGIPKGLVEPGEDLLATAEREFFEETGIKPTPPFLPIGHVTMKSGKVIHAWAFLGEWDPTTGIKSNLINISWPPRSGKILEIPEVDQATWATMAQASKLMSSVQQPFLKRAKDLWPLG